MTDNSGLASALAGGIAFGLAPVQFGLAVTVALPDLDRPESYRAVYALALAHLAGLAVLRALLDDGRDRGPLGLVWLAYLLPLGAAFGVAANHRPHIARAWERVVVSARPDAAKNPAAERLGVEPPRAAPPTDPGPTASRLADWAEVVAVEFGVFARRVWAGTPVWAYALAALAGCARARRAQAEG